MGQTFADEGGAVVLCVHGRSPATPFPGKTGRQRLVPVLQEDGVRCAVRPGLP
jgi:hypothetical protein